QPRDRSFRGCRRSDRYDPPRPHTGQSRDFGGTREREKPLRAAALASSGRHCQAEHDCVSVGLNNPHDGAPPMLWLLIVPLGIVAGTLGGVVGFGSSVLLMPVLVAAFGPKEAVPIMALAALMANISRVAVWWREVDWRVNVAYCATAVPA